MANNNQNQNQPFITPSFATEEKNEVISQPAIDEDDDFLQAQNQLRQVSLSESGWRKELHNNMQEVREIADSTKASTEEGAEILELLLRNLGMPGITFSGKALEMLDKKEEAMFEERSLREQGKSYQTLTDKEKQEVENRLYNGVQFRNDWRRLFDFNSNTNTRFGVKAATPAAKSANVALKTIVENEIRLAAVRDPNLGLDFNDTERVKQIAERIIDDPEFIKILTQQKPTSPNVTEIKFEIIKRIKPENETAGNLPTGN